VAVGRLVSHDPARLLRLRGPVTGYPLEPSNEELAALAGLPAEAIVRYDMNTLGDGPLPAVRDAWRQWDPAAVVEYGDLGYRRLRAAIGEDAGVAPQRVIPGSGADELIRLVTTTVVGPGDAVVVPTPTFPMFAVEAALAGASVVAVPRAHPAQRQPAERIRTAAEDGSARLVWLCSPNNPTGDGMPLSEVAAIADGLEAIVVVDQVYLEFAIAAGHTDLDVVGLTDRLDNVLVLRSLAKSHGLAGARIGYLVVPDALAERFDALRLPLSVGLPTEELAVAALADAVAADARRAAIMGEQSRLADALRRLGCEVLDGVGNFVTFRPPDPAALADALLRRGLVLRAYDAGIMAGWLRATARGADENDRLIAALDDHLG
jgi:histidinol-phosphate aminotransferase